MSNRDVPILSGTDFSRVLEADGLEHRVPILVLFPLFKNQNLIKVSDQGFFAPRIQYFWWSLEAVLKPMCGPENQFLVLLEGLGLSSTEPWCDLHQVWKLSAASCFKSGDGGWQGNGCYGQWRRLIYTLLIYKTETFRVWKEFFHMSPSPKQINPSVNTPLDRTFYSNFSERFWLKMNKMDV